MIPEEAIVLAGGLGTRLRAVVSDVPKPMAPVGGRPFLHWLLDGLARQGVRRVVLATGYMGDVVQDILGEAHAGMRLVYAREESPLGTGGALWAALAHVTGERAFVLNGDTWLGAPLAPLAAEAPAADLTVAVRPLDDRARYGSVRVAGNRIEGLEEKGSSGPGLANAGVYVARRDLPAKRPMAGAFSLEKEVLAKPGDLDLRAHVTEATFLDIGTPEDFARAQNLIPAWAGTTRQPALFLDRDGVINHDTGYTHRIDEFRFRDGIFDLCARAQALGYALVVVTNQAGIGRGYYSEADFQRLTAWMLERFAERGIRFAGVEHCPDHPIHGLGAHRRENPRRKPGPGMLLDAAAAHGLDLARSVMIGDRVSDMQAALAAGVPTRILLCDDPAEVALAPPGTHVLPEGALAAAAALIELMAVSRR